MTTKESIVNQMALRNFAYTRISETVFDVEDLQSDLKTAVGDLYSIIVFAHHGVVTTSATFTAPPKREPSFLQSIIDDIDRLGLRSNPRFRPTKHALGSAKLYVIQAYVRMGNEFPRPSFVLDGERGIVIKWQRNEHSVRLNCFADSRDDDYIYFENDVYDVEDNITPEVLHNRLNWLLRHEREPAR